ncbi:MAG: hypothetical protein LBN33_06395 [Desulfovibrio sp.]|jgi:hypothetical protein|nr:hypothetical protein [Desulfovibrio sp.]
MSTQPASSDIPLHMTPEEGALFRKGLRRAKTYIEFGSGGSTIVAAENEQLSAIYSVESDKKWIKHLLNVPIIRSSVEAKRLHLIHANIGPTQAWGHPVAIDGAYPFPQLYHNYFSAPWKNMLPVNPDAILIDGRFRVATIIMAALIVENQQCLYYVHDYVDSRDYSVIEHFFSRKHNADTLSIFMRKKNFDKKTALTTLCRYAAQPD